MKTTHFGIALYKDGAFEGIVPAGIADTKGEARALAKRWDHAHAGLHDYRAVEVSDFDNSVVWEDERPNDDRIADRLAKKEAARGR